MFLGKGALKICNTFTREHPCWSVISVISIKLQGNFIEITLRHGGSPVNVMHIFRILFPKNICGRLLLNILKMFVGKRSTYKLHAPRHMRKTLTIGKAKILGNVFIDSQLNYASLLWMLCRKTLYSKLAVIDHKILKVIYESNGTDDNLSLQSNTVSGWPEKCHPRKISPGNTPPKKIAPWTIAPK